MALGLAIGAGAGLLKSQLIDAPREARQRKLAAATQRYSPWTGLQAQPIMPADPFGNALQFGATGAALDSNIKTSNAAQNYLNSGGSPKIDFNSGWGGMAAPGTYNFAGGNSLTPASYNSQYLGTIGGQ